MRENYRPHVEELLVAAAAFGSLALIVVLLVVGDSGTRNYAAAIGLIGLFLAWAMLHLLSTPPGTRTSTTANPWVASTSTAMTRRRTATSSTSATTLE